MMHSLGSLNDTCVVENEQSLTSPMQWENGGPAEDPQVGDFSCRKNSTSGATSSLSNGHLHERNTHGLYSTRLDDVLASTHKKHAIQDTLSIRHAFR